MEGKQDFVLHFDPYNEDHVDIFMYYKKKTYLPLNIFFNEPIAKYEVVCERISNKIVHSWSDEIEKRNNRRKTRSRSGSSDGLTTPRIIGNENKKCSRVCFVCEDNRDENEMCKAPRCIIL